MKNDLEMIDVVFSKIVDQPTDPRLSPRLIWVRGLALERQRAARNSLYMTRLLTAAMFLLVVVAGAVFASGSPSASVTDPIVAAACAVFILGYTALQLLRSTP